MSVNLDLRISNQPDYTTCGPTSLHAVYSHYNNSISLETIVSEIKQFEDGGGTLAVVLGQHALKHGHDVTIVSYNINIFDPSWFEEEETLICAHLEESLKRKTGDAKHLFAINQYIRFLKSGGRLRFEDLSSDLLKNILNERVPILTGLSSTWLYREAREMPQTNEPNPIEGSPAGHFIVIDGYDDNGEFLICDPYHKNPINASNRYSIGPRRLINSILLGITSYDGNLLLIKKKQE